LYSKLPSSHRPDFSPANTKARFTKDEMQRELLEQMYRTQELDDLLRESDYTVRRRKECLQMVESLSRASQIVSEVQ
jgi:vacuolar protein sorting-associated protein 1